MGCLFIHSGKLTFLPFHPEYTGSPQAISMFGNSYGSAGFPLSQSHVQGVNNINSMGMLNEMNSNDSSPFDINLDFPQLTSRPGSAGGAQGQLGNEDANP